MEREEGLPVVESAEVLPEGEAVSEVALMFDAASSSIIPELEREEEYRTARQGIANFIGFANGEANIIAPGLPVELVGKELEKWVVERIWEAILSGQIPVGGILAFFRSIPIVGGFTDAAIRELIRAAVRLVFSFLKIGEQLTQPWKTVRAEGRTVETPLPVDAETLALELHESGRTAVESGQTVAAEKLGDTAREFIGWDDLTDNAKNGRRLQANALLERLKISRRQ